MTAQALRLFDSPGQPPEPALDGPLSASRRRTLRNLTVLAEGRHPATKVPLLRVGDPLQDRVCCGDCSWAWPLDRWRCRNADMAMIRISWPACARFERSPGGPAAGIIRGRYPAPSHVLAEIDRAGAE